MRHSIAGAKLNRNRGQRNALFKTQLKQLIGLGSLKTTEAKGKVLTTSVEQLLHKASNDTVHVRRQLRSVLNDTDLVGKAITLATELKQRGNGFVRVVRLGRRRGDNTMIVKLELLAKLAEKTEEKEEIKAGKKEKVEKKTVKKEKKETKK